MQISYHSALTKIQKLQNLKKEKKQQQHFSVPTGTPGTSRYYPKLASKWPVRPVFKPVRNIDISIPVYIPAGTARTGTVLISLLYTNFKISAG